MLLSLRLVMLLKRSSVAVGGRGCKKQRAASSVDRKVKLGGASSDCARAW